LDARLAVLGRREAAMRLRVGELLHALGERYRELAFASLGAYSRERLSRSQGWARDSRMVAKRAQERPVLREAFVQGRISWSALELLLRHAPTEPGDAPDADAELLDAVEGLTVRELREVLRTGADRGVLEGDKSPDSEPERVHVLQLTLRREDALAMAEAEALIRHVDGLGPSGTGLDDCWLEPLLAEGQTSLFDFLPAGDPVVSERIAGQFAHRRRVREEAAARLAHEEERAERALGLGAPRDAGEEGDEGVESAEMFGSELPRCPRAIDAELRALCRELDLADVAFAGVADHFWRMRGWRALGYASDTQYARERLGMSRSSVRQRMGLIRRVGERSALVRALAAGRVGFEAACLLSRALARRGTSRTSPRRTRDTVSNGDDAWIERAEARTYKHLREDVAAAQLLARLEGRSLSEGPPTDEELKRVRTMERDAKSGDAAREVLMDVEGEVSRPVAVVQMSVVLPIAMTHRLASSVVVPAEAECGSLRHLGYTTTRLRLSEEVALHFRQVEAAYGRSGLPGRFVPFLVSALFQGLGGLVGDRSKWEAIHRRDMYECSCPVCERQDVTLHHVTYRSQGGGDEPENLLSLCSFCHLDGEHGGRLRGSASEPVFELGPPSAPLLVVRGRERVAA